MKKLQKGLLILLASLLLSSCSTIGYTWSDYAEEKNLHGHMCVDWIYMAGHLERRMGIFPALIYKENPNDN